MRRGGTGCARRETVVNHLYVHGGKPEHAPLHLSVVGRGPYSFHDPGRGMPVDALQNMGDLMNDHVCHQGRSQIRIRLCNPVVEHLNMHAFVRQSVGQCAGMKRFGSARHEADHHCIRVALAEAGPGVPFQLHARRQEHAGGLCRSSLHSAVFAIFDANHKLLTVGLGTRPRAACQYRRHRDHR